MAVKAEDLKETWEKVAGLHPNEMRQWLEENMYQLPYMIAYLLGYARFKVKDNVMTTQELPACRFCGKVAGYRGKIHSNEVWFDMCEGCFAIQGQGLGSGIGYKLELVKL